MNQPLVDAIVNAVLYEGYMLYPYRPSVKNRHRWTFGGLYPRAYSEAHDGSDLWAMQTECLVRGGHRTTLRVQVRFLHVLARSVSQVDLESGTAGRPVKSLLVAGRLLHSWQEAAEREVSLPEVALGSLLARPHLSDFAFPAERHRELVHSPDGAVVAALERESQSVEGEVGLSAEPAAEGLFRLRVRIENHTLVEDAISLGREEAQLRALASTHTLLGVSSGEFVSMIDPPDRWRTLAGACRNVGAWPVLVGDPGQKDTILSSPIILYDYPQVAPESPGNLFDGTEIDEILTLRILTLTDEEKRAAAAADERVRDLLQRSESLTEAQFRGLHGAVRGLRPVPAGGQP